MMFDFKKNRRERERKMTPMWSLMLINKFCETHGFFFSMDNIIVINSKYMKNIYTRHSTFCLQLRCGSGRITKIWGEFYVYAYLKICMVYEIQR